MVNSNEEQKNEEYENKEQKKMRWFAVLIIGIFMLSAYVFGHKEVKHDDWFYNHKYMYLNKH
jgi:uncharacterized membrane protein